MQKLKNRLLDRMIACRLTSNEVDFLLYLSRFQNNTGEVSGIHYKEVCQAMGISRQGFYDVKASLIQKGLIRSEKNSQLDHDITILENEFITDAQIREGYLNTNHNIFYQEAFYHMKAGAKLLAMELMKLTYAGSGQAKIGTRKFYAKYTELFGVTKRVMRGYLMAVKKFFSVQINKGIYCIRPRNTVYRKAGQATEQDNYNGHSVAVACRRNRIKDQEPGARKDVATLLNQYRKRAAEAGKEIGRLLEQAVTRSLEILNGEGRPQRRRELRPKLIHMILKEMLAIA